MAKRHNLKIFPLVSTVLTATLLVVCAASFWRHAGWVRRDESWVTPPGSGMMELHTHARIWMICRGRIELSEAEVLSAVIPAGSSAAGKPRSESTLLWQPSEPTRIRAWDDRWHLTRWNEWRLGELGCYETTGGGATSHVFSVPLWLAIALVGMPCWLWTLRNLRARRRRTRGVCVVCGYDRRGIAEFAAVCPECGATGGHSK